MSLIDSTYFVKDINVPSSTYSDLDNYITRYEKEILQKLLGYELWKLVAAYDGTAGVITDFVEGKEYTNSAGDLDKWNGITNTDLVSLVAYYVFYHWVRDKETTTGTNGTLQLVSENSLGASPAQRLHGAWVNLRDLYDKAYDFLSEHMDDYPTWVFEPLGNVNAWDL